MTPTRNQLLLHEICDLIPDADTATLIRSMDPYDHLTFAEAYCAVRTLPTLTRDLRRRLLAEISALADVERGQLGPSSDDDLRPALPDRRPTVASV